MSRSLFAALCLCALAPLSASAATTITSPDAIADDARPKVFLAGSIEMGRAGDWQQDVQDALADLDVVLLNPRRADWNPD